MLQEFAMRMFFVTVFAALLAALNGSLYAETVLDVEHAVETAIQNNLSLARSRIETGMKERASAQSWNALYPALSAGAQTSKGVSLTGDVPAAREDWSNSLSFSASLAIQPSVFANMKKLKADYEAGMLSYEAAKQELELNVRKAFYQILLLKANLGLAGQTVETAEAGYRQTAALARAGQASALDELSARVSWENLKPEWKTAEANYLNALESFQQTLGISIPSKDLVLSGSLDDWAGLTATVQREEGGLAGSVMSKSNENRNEPFTIAALRRSVASLKAQHDTLWMQSWLPTLGFTWNSSPALSDGAWLDSGGSFTVSLRLSLDPFLPASAARAQLAALDDNRRIAAIQLEEAAAAQNSRIAQLERSIEKSAESIATLSLNSELARQSYEMTSDAYRRGAADLQKLRNAADSLSQAGFRLQSEQYNLIAAILDLEKELNIPFGSLLRE
jgi:outer membrane protein TolC